MELEKRELLTAELRSLVAEIAADLHRQLVVPGPARTRAEVVYKDERVGYDFDVWLDLLARRAAVLWVLKTVYVRVLEDRGFLTPVRLRDRESQDLFEHLTPGLGDTAYLRWIFKDLASEGGLPELFAPQQAEVALPSNDLSKKLLAFWRRQDEATGALRFRFDDEHFDGRLMGDLYQDLDPVVKERYALLQTPGFIVDFILDETLTPAIETFGVDVVRVIDPACGSGHFLLVAFKRLVAGMRERFPDRPHVDIIRDVLARVVGIDLNDYACALARARLVMTAMETAGDDVLSAGTWIHPQVYWADGLDQVEGDEQVGIAGMPAQEVRATLTRPKIREALRPVLKPGFHVVVANPPFITESDATNKEYHRPRYRAAYREYSLGVVFTERLLQLAIPDGFVGEITANSFARREFGRALIERVLPRYDITTVIDSSGAHIPGHGTPTLMLFARRRPPRSAQVQAVMGKRSEPGTPSDAAHGRVWTQIVGHHKDTSFDGEFISVSTIERAKLNNYPWTLAGGGAVDLLETLKSDRQTVGSLSTAIGFMCIPKQDEVYILPRGGSARRGIPPDLVRPIIAGQDIGHWAAAERIELLFPYDSHIRLRERDDVKTLLATLWPYRTTLYARKVFGGGDFRSNSKPWYEYGQIPADRFAAGTFLGYAAVSTHNRFVIESGARVFKDSAPVIVFRPAVPQSTRLQVAAALNSSCAGFMMRQVSQAKAGSGIGRGIQPEPWMERYQFGANKIKSIPIPTDGESTLPFVERLHTIAQERVADTVAEIVSSTATSGAISLRAALAARRSRDSLRLFTMVALQEELDWLCYRLYGIDRDAPKDELRSADEVTPFCPGLRPFEISLAQRDRDRCDALARGDEPDEAPSAWFERHGWAPVTSLDEIPERERRIVGARLARTAASRELSLIEVPTYKRRWQEPDYDAEEAETLETWLADRIEDWAKQRRVPFTVEEAASAVQIDPCVLAVAEVLTGRPDFNLIDIIAERVHEHAVPNQKYHVYKPSGLRKRAAWERTWDMQRAEDDAAKRNSTAPVPPVPPEYGKADYLRDGFWTLRGALDVPKERFIALTEVPGREGKDLLFAWAGLTHRERAKMLVEADEVAERAGIDRSDRIGLLHGIWFLADYVAWESESAARQYRAAVTTVVGQAGITEELLSEWAARHPVPKLRRSKPKPKKKNIEEIDES